MNAHLSLALLSLTLGLMPARNAVAADQDAVPGWVFTQDGAYAVNRIDLLAWRRCAEGMLWDGKTCTGQPTLMTYAEAMALVVKRKEAEGVPWRLPSVAELQHLVNKSVYPVGPDSKVFPAAPRDWHWAGTANVKSGTVNPYNYGTVMQGQSAATAGQASALKAWAVNLKTGEARGDVTKRSRLPVRLVATQKPD